ncbi:MAG: hypothetical protein LBD45_07015, partial [Bacteroidales bacterium]|nr:hypothetical protein [Bacteroidales bacterium]
MPEIKKGLAPFTTFLIKLGDFFFLNTVLYAINALFEATFPNELAVNYTKVIFLVVNLCYVISV